MDLNRIKELLNCKGIPFEVVEYKSESDFWNHIALFPHTKNAAHSKVIAIVINSNNKNKNLELQFNASKEGYVFRELWFGEYSFETFDYEPDILEFEIFSDIENVMSGNFMAFSVNDLKKKQWLSDGLIEKDGEDAEKLKQNMVKPKSWIERIFKTQRQYELYDWNNYQKVVK